MQTKKLLQRAMETADLPAELLPETPRITLEGNTCLSVENHGGIDAYTQACIRIHTALGMLEIAGEALVIRTMDRRKMLIGGIIRQISLQEEDYAAHR